MQGVLQSSILCTAQLALLHHLTVLICFLQRIQYLILYTLKLDLPHSNSSLSPVYAAVGKSSFSDPIPLHYASTTDNHTVTGVPKPFSKGDNMADRPPLYEELRASKNDQELGDTIVRNESYGLIMRSKPSPKMPEDNQ